ncbi:MAG: hypothetical protein AAF988_01480 [Pseudomonadota bacterium]
MPDHALRKLKVGDIIVADSSWMLNDIRYGQISVGQNTTRCPVTGDIAPVYDSPEYMSSPYSDGTDRADFIREYAERVGLRLRGKYFVVEEIEPTLNHGEYIFARECDASGFPLDEVLRTSFYHGTSGHHINIPCPKIVGHNKAKAKLAHAA